MRDAATQAFVAASALAALLMLCSRALSQLPDLGAGPAKQVLAREGFSSAAGVKRGHQQAHKHFGPPYTSKQAGVGSSSEGGGAAAWEAKEQVRPRRLLDALLP